MIEAFYASPWPGIAFCAVLFISDSQLTITCAKMYQSGVRERFVFAGSYELTPYHQTDVDARRRFSPRFLFALVAVCVILGGIWWVAVRQAIVPVAYEFSLGALGLIQLMIHVRHLRNYFLFRTVLAGQGITGRTEYSRPVLLAHSAVELFSFAALYAILAAVTANWFILGGAFACVVVGVKHRQLGRQHTSHPVAAPGS